MITQHRQMYASHVDFDSFWVSCFYFDPKNFKGNSLQPKLKEGSVWPFNACTKVPTN